MKNLFIAILLSLPLCASAQTKISTTADQTVTGMTPVTANTLQFAVTAGDTYHVTGDLIVTGNANATGSFNPNSSVFSTAGFSGNIIIPNALYTLYPNSGNPLPTHPAGYRVTRLNFYFTAATTGTFSFAIYGMTSTHSLTLKKGSSITYELIP